MMENKQASIVDELYHDLSFEIDWRDDMEKLFEQANKIFKQQIIDACNQQKFKDIDGLTKGEQYYNEIFAEDEDSEYLKSIGFD